MTSKLKKVEEHLFQIELKSKDYMKSVALPSDETGSVLIEGFLGKLENVSFVEGVMLEINGVNGSLRMDFAEEDLKRYFQKGQVFQKLEKIERGNHKK